MTDQNEGQIQEVEEQTTPDMPAETKPVESTEPTSETVTQEDETQELPDGASERTKEQFEKLTRKNRELAERLAAYESQQEQAHRKSALDAFNPQIQAPSNLSQGQVDQIAQNYVDENGYVDVNALNQALMQASRVAQDASERARKAEERIATYEHTDQTRRTYAKHPELDPYNQQFNQRFNDLVKLELLRQMTEEGTQNYMAAADRVRKDFYDPSIEVNAKKQETLQKQKASQEQLAQASAQPGANKQVASPMQHQQLVEGTRKGDRDALYKRLQASGY